MEKNKYPLHDYGNNCPDNVQIITLKEVDSTNNYLKQLPDEMIERDFVVAVAQCQTAGRGQRGNTWESEPGKNLLFSIMMRPTFIEARNQFILSQAIALSIKETLEHYIHSPYPRIKWPNDIYWNKKKLCGILIENDLIGKHVERCIIGAGINLNQEHFYSDAPNPVSVCQITGSTTEPLTILRKILQRFITYYEEIRQGNIRDLTEHYHKALFRRIGYHKFRQNEIEFEARIKGVETDGHLILEDTDGNPRRCAFKEVEYVL